LGKLLFQVQFFLLACIIVNLFPLCLWLEDLVIFLFWLSFPFVCEPHVPDSFCPTKLGFLCLPSFSGPPKVCLLWGSFLYNNRRFALFFSFPPSVCALLTLSQSLTIYYTTASPPPPLFLLWFLLAPNSLHPLGLRCTFKQPLFSPL